MRSGEVLWRGCNRFAPGATLLRGGVLARRSRDLAANRMSGIEVAVRPPSFAPGGQRSYGAATLRVGAATPRRIVLAASKSR